MKYVYYVIYGGSALELVKQHIADVQRVRAETTALAKEIGVERYRVTDSNGVITSVDFGNGPHHPDFKKPNKYGSSPKKGTGWYLRFQGQKGYESSSSPISETFSVPLTIAYGKEGSKGWRRIGYPFDECGFMYLSADGPYGMYCVDVEAEVSADREKGYEVDEPAASFKMSFDGARRIEKEEWEILVAQHKLEKKRAGQEVEE